MAYSNSWVNSTPAIELNIPVAPTAHDVLVLAFITDTQNAGDTVTIKENDVVATSNWTLVGSPQVTTGDNQTLWVYYKLDASGSETSIKPSISSTNTIIGVVYAFSGRDNTAALDGGVGVGYQQAQTSSNTTNTPTVSLTPASNGCDLVAINGADVSSSGANPTFTFSTTSGTTEAWTTRQDQNSTFWNLGSGTSSQVTAGAITVTCTRSVSSGNALAVLALKPAAGGSTTQETDAASAGVASTSGVGGLIAQTDSASTGTGAGTGVSGSTNIIEGSAAGVATGSGVAATVLGSDGASAGAGSVAGETQAFTATAGSSDGAATVSGVGALTATTASSSSGAGSATGVSGATSGSPGAADGVATVSGVGALTATTVFSSDGTGTVAGVGENANTSVIEETDAAAAGVGAVAGVTAAVFAADASAAGVAEVLGEVGTHQLLVATVTGVATGEGNLNVPTSVSLSADVVGTITLTGALYTETPVVWDTTQGMAGHNRVRDAKRLAQHDAEDLQDIFQMVANLWP